MEDVQQQPSAAVFPGGEAMTAMPARAVEAVRRRRRRVGPAPRRAGGLGRGQPRRRDQGHPRRRPRHPLDLFQRIAVSPGSVSAITGRIAPTVRHVNDLG